MKTLQAALTPDSKKSYLAPRLISHGTLHQLTLSGTGSVGEIKNNGGNCASNQTLTKRC